MLLDLCGDRKRPPKSSAQKAESSDQADELSASFLTDKGRDGAAYLLQTHSDEVLEGRTKRAFQLRRR